MTQRPHDQRNEDAGPRRNPTLECQPNRQIDRAGPDALDRGGLCRCESADQRGQVIVQPPADTCSGNQRTGLPAGGTRGSGQYQPARKYQRCRKDRAAIKVLVEEPLRDDGGRRSLGIEPG